MKNKEIESFAPRFWTVREVSKAYGLGISTVWRKVKLGEFPRPVKVSPGATRWRSEDLNDWAKDPMGWSEKQGEA